MPDFLYPLARRALFRLDAETAHEVTIGLLSRLPRTAGLLAGRPASSPRKVMGLDFRNPVGLAAGLDKNAECIEAWFALGFGFVEVGTTTPRPQPGNPKPRLFRIESRQALINRLGFNNKGVDALARRVKASHYDGVLGINIGKNSDTPLADAAKDYLYCLEKVYPLASYVTVNISSPNTEGLRDLQKGEALEELLPQLKQAQTRLADQHGRYVPLVLKVAPDMDDSQLQTVADALRRHRMDAVIATNTTVSKSELASEPLAREEGGLSGGPLLGRATEVLRRLHRMLQGELPIIGLGGILSGEDARAKRDAGADLVQIYTGFIYRGPELVRECVSVLS